MPEPTPQRPTLDDAMATLRAHRRGDLLFDDAVRSVRFVLDPQDGRLVMPAMVAMLSAAQPVLFLPEESEEALQLLVSMEEIDGESHATADRWRIYHGEPEDVRWAACWIDSARLGPMVFDGDALMVPNALASDEPALCKELNADKDGLHRLCAQAAGVECENPVCVGVDPEGLDIRRRFDIVRIPFPKVAENADGVRAAVAGLVKQDGSQA